MMLQVANETHAEPARVWQVLINWAGQSQWIPLTSVKVIGGRSQGVGVRAVVLSGFRLGRLPIGLLDNIVVTGWTPPRELVVQHLGPYFTGKGIIRLEPSNNGTRVTAIEDFLVRGGRPVEALVRLALPLLRIGFRHSLRGLAEIAES